MSESSNPVLARAASVPELLEQARKLEASGSHEQILAMSAALLTSIGNLPESSAERTRWEGQAHDLTAQAAYSSADFYRATDSFRQACRCYEGDDWPAYFEAQLGLGLCLDHLGHFEESQRLNRSIIGSPQAAPSQKAVAKRNLIYAEGVRSFSAADFGAAQACFAKALSLHPGDDDFRSDILMWMGACHSQLGQFAAAEETYSDLLTSDGTHDSVKHQANQWRAFAEGQVHFAARRYQEARVKFEEILKRRGTANEFRSGVTLMLAHCCFHLCDYGQARRRYRHILKTRNASREQKEEARQWRRALPGLLERCLRVFGHHLGWGVR
jgi:tetratricopeptide (TPR) repeat protein